MGAPLGYTDSVRMRVTGIRKSPCKGKEEALIQMCIRKGIVKGGHYVVLVGESGHGETR